MPRMAAVIGVWTAVLFAIGFNIAHYPVVWEIVAPPAGGATPKASSPASSSPQAQPTPVASSADRAAPSATETVTDRTPPSEAPGAAKQYGKFRVQCDGQSCKLVPTEEAAPAAAATKAVAQKPAATAASPATTEAAPAGTFAKVSEASYRKSPAASPAPDAQTPPSAAAPDASSPSRVRRLPELTREWVPPTAPASAQASGRIPLYATTGVD
jgi:hypothetical protein